MLIRKIVFILSAAILLLNSNEKSFAGQIYEKRALETVTLLGELNGFYAWPVNEPDQWPQTPSAGPEDFAAQSLGLRASVIWSSDKPKRLLSINLKNMNLNRTADFSGLSQLKRLELDNNSLRGINIDGDRELLRFSAANNQLSAVRLEGAPNLAFLNLANNRLDSVDFKPVPGLASLTLSGNPIATINLVNLSKLETLELNNCRLSELDLTGNPQLKTLNASSNKINRLDLRLNNKLVAISARDNQLTEIDLSSNTDVSELFLSKNKIQSIDLSKNAALEKLDMDSNQLTHIDLSRSHMIKNLTISANPLQEINIGDNQFSQLEQIDLHSCRLALSQLAQFSGKAQNRARFGTQEQALFQNKKIYFNENLGGAVLDLSTEAKIKTTPSKFVIRTDKKRNVKLSDYEVKGGIILFKKPGSYIIEMSNEEVFSHQKAHNSSQMHRLKIKVFTGVVEVIRNPT